MRLLSRRDQKPDISPAREYVKPSSSASTYQTRTWISHSFARLRFYWGQKVCPSRQRLSWIPIYRREPDSVISRTKPCIFRSLIFGPRSRTSPSPSLSHCPNSPPATEVSKREPTWSNVASARPPALESATSVSKITSRPWVTSSDMSTSSTINARRLATPPTRPRCPTTFTHSCRTPWSSTRWTRRLRHT